MTSRTSLTVLVAALVALAGCDFSDFGVFDTPAVRPEQAKFTILLMTVRGPNHIALADTWNKETVKRTGWQDTWVLNKESYSLLFRGRYRTLQHAEGYLKKAKEFKTRENQRPYRQAITYPLPGQNPGRPEYDISKSPQQFCYTVLVADYFNVTDAAKPYLSRKEDAVALCEQYRAKQIEAFYHHGPTHSAVMVGLFDESAVRITKVLDPRTNLPTGDTRPKIISREVLAIQKRFPYLAVNGYEQWNKVTDPVTGKVAKQREKCRLITIPGRKPDHNRARTAPGGSPWRPGPDRPRLPF